jgi:protein phosphatase
MNLEGKLEIAGLSDVGRRRSHNEDSIASDIAVGIAVLADGVGGNNAGEVASSIAVHTIVDSARKSLRSLSAGNIEKASGHRREALVIKSAIDKANEIIYQEAENKPEYRGMATTVVATMFYDDRMIVAHVGDSRLYRLRGKALKQITMDHSLLQELVNQGVYTSEEVKHVKKKNLVTRAVGIESTVTTDLREETVKPGDIHLLCSDGLSDRVEDDAICAILNSHRSDLRKAAEALVDIANDKGGQDNISVMLVRTLAPFPAVEGKTYGTVCGSFG